MPTTRWAALATPRVRRGMQACGAVRCGTLPCLALTTLLPALLRSALRCCGATDAGKRQGSRARDGGISLDFFMIFLFSACGRRCTSGAQQSRT